VAILLLYVGAPSCITYVNRIAKGRSRTLSMELAREQTLRINMHFRLAKLCSINLDYLTFRGEN